MKNLVIIALLVGSTFITAQEYRTTLGRHGSCSGRGICSFSQVESGSMAKSANEKSVGLEKLSNHQFLVKLDLAELTAQEERSIAGKSFKRVKSDERPTFLMEESLQLDDQTCKSLELNPGCEIPKGEYPLFLKANEVWIELKIENK